MIQLRDITKQIGNRIVLDHVTAQMSEETVTGFQGINGSGKTMLMRVIAGLVRPTSGSVSINGKRLGRDLSMPESMGILIENPVFLDSYTGLQNLELLASLKGRTWQSLENGLQWSVWILMIDGNTRSIL